jgi:ABC-type sugar transport system permease subunit/outer membrane protein assembly factor BamB
MNPGFPAVQRWWERVIRTAPSLFAFLLFGAALAVPAMPGRAHAQDASAWTVETDAIVYDVASSADGDLIVAGRRDNAVVAYDAGGGVRWTFETGGTVFGVAVSAAGRRVAIASEDRNVYLLDDTGAELWRYRGPRTFGTVSITNDGGIIVAGSDDRLVSAFDEGGTLLWQHTAGDVVNKVAVYGATGAFRVVAGTRDSRVALLSGQGERLWESLLDYEIHALAVVPTGARIVAGDDAGAITMLDGARGTPVWSQSADHRVNDIAISDDARVITAVTAGGDVVILSGDGSEIQRISTGTELFALSIPEQAAAAILARGDGILHVPRSPGGQLDIEPPRSVWRRIGFTAAAAFAVIVLVAVALGLRRSPHGERAWRPYVRRQRHLSRQIWRARLSYLFLVPTISLLLVFNYYPAFSGIYHAFTIWVPGAETRWVGFDQFRALSNDSYFWIGTGNLVILILTAFAKLAVPLLVAELIFHLRSSRLRYAMRTGFVLQVIVPGVVGILLWVNIYDPNIGLANQTLRALGLGSWTRSWLGESDTALWAIVFMGFPWVSAFALLIFYGGLISIPSELFDAAEVDGANAFRRFINIDLPLLLSQVRLLVILTFITVVQEFAAIFLTTGGGPGSSTYVPSLELYYQAMRFNNFGLASAIGAVLFVVILGGTVLNLRYVKSSVEYGT